MNKLLIITLVLVTLVMSSIVFAEYAATRIYFNIPAIRTFTITMPDTYSGTGCTTCSFAITGTTEATATPTDFVSFNFTSSPDSLREPSAKGNFTRNQSQSSNKPIFRIINTGNTNITLTLYYNSSIGTSFNVSANSTCETGGCTAVAAIFNITQAAQSICTNLNTSITRCNVTLWGFANSGLAGGETAGPFLITNSTV